MTLFGWEIRRSGSPAEASEALEGIRTQLAEIERRTRTLELERADLARVVTEGTEKWLKYLKRVQELTRRGETGESEPADQLSRQLLALKFPNGISR